MTTVNQNEAPLLEEKSTVRFPWNQSVLLAVAGGSFGLSLGIGLRTGMEGVARVAGVAGGVQSGLLLGIVVLAVVIVTAIPLCKWRDESEFRTRANTLTPLILSFPCICLFDTRAWSSSPLLYFLTSMVILAVVFWCSFEPWKRRCLQASPGSNWRPVALLVCAIFAYTSYVSFHTILRHYSFETDTWDLGIKESVIWNTLHGKFMWSGVEGLNHLRAHTAFLMLLFVPFYAIFPSTELLLVLQALITALAAWPLFLIVRRQRRDDWDAALIGISYLLHPIVAGANFYDFHLLMAAPLIFFFGFYWWLQRRRVAMCLALLLLMLIKQDLALLVFGFGAYSILSRRFWDGVILCSSGVVMFLVLTRLVIPSVGGSPDFFSFYFSDLVPPGESMGTLLWTILTEPSILLTMLRSPDRQLYIFQIFTPVLFLPFLRLRSWCLLGYGLLSTVGATRPALFRLGYQYGMQLLPYAYVCALMEMRGVEAWFLKHFRVSVRRAFVTSLMSASILVCYQYGMVFPRHNFVYDFSYTATEKQAYGNFLELIRQIPAEASVVASRRLAPHVVQRRSLEIFGIRRADVPINPDYFLLMEYELSSPEVGRYPGLAPPMRYLIVGRTDRFVLLKAPSMPGGGNGAP